MHQSQPNFNHGLDIVAKDLQYLWHPCSQMQDYETFKPLVIKKAYGCFLELEDGKKIIDAIASWWCKSLGHNHPKLQQALIQQAEQFAHVILANTTNHTIVKLSEKLANICQPLTKVFYASDGSSAVEIALKMSLQTRVNLGNRKKNKFIALANGYHGETALALAVSDLGLYKQPFQSILPPCYVLQHIPYVSGQDDPLWHDCSAIWPRLEQQLNTFKFDTTAIILEPIVQGAGQMQIYSADFLKKLHLWANANDIHIIADEIMTGIGRTGTMLALEHAGCIPDFICLAKGLTSGWLPLSAVVTSNAIYDTFYADYAANKAFMHSHTHSGNALAASIAIACLEVIEAEKILPKVQSMAKLLVALFNNIKTETGKIHNIRHIGGIVAADLIVQDPKTRLGFAIYQEAVKLGALLRPLGNTIYWLPPLNISQQHLYELYKITVQAINKVLK